MKDEFREIQGYPDYMITSDGRVWSKERKVLGRWGNYRVKKGRWIKQVLSNCGYLRAPLFTGGKQKKSSVHRLVALTWVKGYFDGAVVDHINGIKTDNRTENLQWVTTQQNAEKGSAKGYLILLPDGSQREIYNLEKFCREVGIKKSTRLYETLNGKKKQYKGFKLLKRLI